ncbi:DedA family protein [Pullulanibacillus sp. KACC 23026]|uniref:DedA family protein n=1 Tax=Pullulanibacillus sp. KACC 23026 TaxID=3028315 RepID=UPI0023B09806|nr:DedA family protein [Pullulanibacillus sp. KACC 23026]WEG11859.1 DedA family protein [Pullulanibacillus sp. KACC 23026]
MDLLSSIQPLIQHYGYFGVFIILCLEMIGIPFPAETTLVLSGVEWKQGIFSFFPLVLSGILGHLLGSSIAYSIGRYLGRPFLIRYQRIFRITDATLDRAQQRLEKARAPVLIISKFIAGIRIIVPYLAGINGLPFTEFIVWSSVGTIIWVFIFIMFGQTVAFLIHHAIQVISQNPYLSIPIGLVLLGIIIAFFIFKAKRKKQLRERESSVSQDKD